MRAAFLRFVLPVLFVSVPISARADDLGWIKLRSLPAIFTGQAATADWSGIYVGGFGNQVTGVFNGSVGSVDSDGYHGGVFAGYDLVVNGYIVGGEADIGLGRLQGSSGAPSASFDKRIDGSVCARAGVTIDRVLLYRKRAWLLQARMSCSTTQQIRLPIWDGRLVLALMCG